MTCLYSETAVSLSTSHIIDWITKNTQFVCHCLDKLDLLCLGPFCLCYLLGYDCLVVQYDEISGQPQLFISE